MFFDVDCGLQCCQSLGNQPCAAKGHRKSVPAPPADPASLHPFLHRIDPNLTDDPALTSSRVVSRRCVDEPASTPSPSISSNRPKAVPHRKLPAQSAQAGGRIAHLFNSDQLINFYNLRLMREQGNAQAQRLEAEENKVVTVLAWLVVRATAAAPLKSSHIPHCPPSLSSLRKLTHRDTYL